jgi:hypothetical protein
MSEACDHLDTKTLHFHILEPDQCITGEREKGLGLAGLSWFLDCFSLPKSAVLHICPVATEKL